MGLITEKFLLCDFCGESYGVDTRQFNTAKQLREDAHRNGWVFYNNHDYCADCRKKRRGDYERKD